MTDVKLYILMAVCSLIITLIEPLWANIYYVYVDESIQAAIDAASNGDEIKVGPGIYYESIDLKGKSIRLFSSEGQNVTTIDASGILGAYHVVQCISGEDTNTVLNGFTITGGNACGSDPNDQSGGGMFNYQSSPTVINCTFIKNTADYYGGGMYNIDNSNPTVMNCTFSKNNAGHGGGIHNMNNSSPMVINCSFSGNTASFWGGGMRNFRSNPTVTNCTFSGNTVKYLGGGGMHNYESSTTITNCILWDNAPDEIYDAKSSSIISYSNVQGGWSGIGNIDADPCFINVAGGDLRLSSSDSPCIDTGTNTPTAGLPIKDLVGHPRIIDSDCNGMAIVDMGAYEFNYAHISDFDYNCSVNLKDFSILGISWNSQMTDSNWNSACNIGFPVDNYIDRRDLSAFCENWLVNLP